VHPCRRRDGEAVDEVEHRGSEALPAEVGLETGEQQELLADLIAHQVEVERRRLVVGEVVVLELDDRPTRSIVEQLVDVEGRHDLVVEGVEQVVAQLGDRRSCVGEAGQTGDQVQPSGHRLRNGSEFVEVVRVEHAPTLDAGISSALAGAPHRVKL